jgi:hypothetical protein
MTPREKEIRQKLKDDYKHYASKCLKIRTKSGKVEPLIFNKAQDYINTIVEEQRLKTGKVRVIILKGRQQGCSTYTEGRFYWRVTHQKGLQAFILTHALDATNNLFKMAQRFHENCPTLVRPELGTSNSKELVFSLLDSGYKIGTAENKSVGRSSTIQLLHSSEAAFQNNAAEHAKGIMQAVPAEEGTEIFIESTANGIGNYFHEQWQKAEAGLSDFIPIFCPWFWQDEYVSEIPEGFVLDETEQELVSLYRLTREQLSWRRRKIVDLSVGGMEGSKFFAQEYPCNPLEAFQTSGDDSFISSSLALSSVKNDGDPEVEAIGPLLIGADPARFGDDRTSICWRKGRVVKKIVSYLKKDTMEVAGILHNIIEEDKPARVFIDVVGLGAGVFDRLKELGHGNIIVAVNGGSSPRNANKYFNKRAEMWGDMKDWMLDFPCSIPNHPSLLSDLCGLTFKFDSKGRLVLERKEDAKKRGIRSPDEADCIALTFSYPESALLEIYNKNERLIASKVSSQFKTVQNLKNNRKW